ncbi:8-amino-7-oxononanoate synthase [uncultured Parabacteroides sp.]|uniref:8-amino-7-oxononanoate synthase n=1 Tax=uncultured Parabacteroides sp. TaxID=512312 RepID=UPI0025D71434|nr:8-amino-7-oxononanoate synthase [uncultured Parabacteroides sp.]
MKDYNSILQELENSGNLRRLPEIVHKGNLVEKGGLTMLNLSSNDYLGLASRRDLQQAFLKEWQEKQYPFSSSSSRLLTGNFRIYTELEQVIAERFDREATLLFNSGYHANTGILPALADKQTLILADKLVHASIIDGILLSNAPFQRFRHNDYDQLETLLQKNTGQYEQIFIVTESIFSMDGDVANLRRLVSLKKSYPDVCLYVDEAHAIGVRGKNGLGIAEEQDCIQEIDLLVGTFGKALASMGAYVICSRVIREYLINCMRPLIFSTALPPAQIAWTQFIFERLPEFSEERERLATTSHLLIDALSGKGGEISESHIIPYIIGDNKDCILKAEELQRKGFYCLPVRPPTVPKGTARIRFSLTADVTTEDIQQLIQAL